VKPRNRHSRSLNVSSSRWTAYAIAGLATASGGSISAEGAIHYSGLIDYKFESLETESHTFPLSHGAVLEGYRVARGGGGASSATFLIKGAAVSNKIGLYTAFSLPFVAKPLPRGAVISEGFFNFGGAGRLQDYSCSFPGWMEPGTHAIGFRFNSGHGMQYGWVRIKWAGCGYPRDNRFEVKDYAWGDPGDKIKAGQTQLHEDETQVAPLPAKSDDAAAAEASTQGSLGLLALGAVGLQAWRRSRRGDE